MHLIQILGIVCYLWIDVEGACLVLTQPYDEGVMLRIPDNSLVEGGEMSHGSWYRTVNWKQAVEGSLWLKILREKGQRPEYDYADEYTYLRGSVNICDLRASAEWGQWSRMVRDLLGLAGCPVQAGEVEVDGAYFKALPCKDVVINSRGSASWQKLSLDVTDDNDNLLLTGHLEVYW